MRTKFVLTLLFCSLFLCAQARKEPETLRYDIECAGNGTNGIYLVKVWVYGDANKITSDVIKKYAVHGVIFKGFTGNGCTTQKPMAQSPTLEQDKADFFKAFFDTDKTYARYATLVEGSDERVKIGKEYKIGAVVSVSKDMLRTDLEKAGIIRGLSSGF